MWNFIAIALFLTCGVYEHGSFFMDVFVTTIGNLVMAFLIASCVVCVSVLLLQACILITNSNREE
jgi:hypothetical protein